MEKEQFRNEVKRLLEKAFHRMNKCVDNFCDSDYLGFEHYSNNNRINTNDFVQALLNSESNRHSPIGYSEATKRKSRKRVQDYWQAVIYNK